ncbi:retron Eco8 family effector endonuclease [Lysinibacillus xylanilyticus]|uniref:retron Eco8 family effector endonuclease n=1 Tax=Lysinibacillus xylanilyticus TaxID=582475 RepID=UPI00382D82BA
MIQEVEFVNVKSYKKIRLTSANLNLILGENGAGKSNFIKLMEAFYLYLEKSVFLWDEYRDKNNPYIEKMSLSITYNIELLKKIVRNQISRLDLESENFNYFLKIFSLLNTYSEKNLLTVKIEVHKSGRIKCNIKEKSDRKLIINLFPLHILRAREIELTDWKNIWNLIAQIGRLTKKKQDELSKIISDYMPEVKNKESNYLKEIERILRKNDIEVKKSYNNDNLYRHLLGGDQISFLNKELNYYSDGLNSYNYIKLYMELINWVPTIKLKFPIIILDEPEISLHTGYIDRISELINENNDRVTLFIATHSSRLLKNLFIACEKINVYQFKYEKNYSKIYPLNMMIEEKGKHLLSEKETSYFFEKMIVFVEGATEIQLFNSPELKDCFDILKQVSVYSFDSDIQKLRLLHPLHTDISIPFLTLLDMDKIYKYEKQNSKIVIIDGDNAINPLKNKVIAKQERLSFGKQRNKTLNLRKRIENMINKTSFYYDNIWGVPSGNSYHNELHKLIKEYCENYNVYPNSTTIEGVLINKNSLIYYIEWLKWKNRKNQRKIQNIDNCFSNKLSLSIKLTIARLIQKGKFDNMEIFSNKKIGKMKSNIAVAPIVESIEELMQGKTSGWVNEFIKYYFKEIIRRENLTKDEIRGKIKNDFPELYHIISLIESIY